MANIALREYHRKIESLIEDHKIDEALSHCVNIYQRYPKEIETYRKLGKIFLEKQNFTIAEKVFNIILSVFPDDFIANVGLSFIAEQGNRMDDAIKFMEYAFEIQPANESLQDELKRLYNKRDGVEPTKIRLTRGALIKMYARSALLDQAIAEIRLGIYEKPKRLDYKLTLADMLWQSGKSIEAVETCVSVISQLPYCWVTNKILDQAFKDFDKNQEDNSYRSRLIELNPYYKYMLPSTKNINDIPDIAVQINDRLAASGTAASFDWKSFLDSAWTIPEEDIKDSSASASDLNWSSIIDESLETKPAEELAENKAQVEAVISNSSGSNKKSAFIERLQKRSSSQQTESEIPDWINEGYEQEPDSAKENSLLAAEPEPLDDAGPNILNKQSDAEEVPANYPEIEDETGLVDQDVPVMSELIEDENSIASAWISAETNSSGSNKEKLSLKDTQEIKISSDNPDEILLQAGKAIEGRNYQFALTKLHQLADENSTYLDSIKELLENACENHPQVSNLWLALGGIYQRLDLNEKALKVFIRAQKQISL